MNRKSKKYVLLIAVLFILLPVLFAGNSLIEAQKPLKLDRQDFREDMRRLWTDHSELTRSFMISIFSDLPDQNEAAQNLIQKQNEIGDAIKPFYGDAAGDELAGLLNEHARISATLLESARKADAPAFEESVADWYANADTIAQFLRNTNPENWPLRKTKPMMRVYLDLTLEQALARWNGDFEKENAAHEKVQEHALEIADMLSDGIINKFGRKFR